MPLQLVQAGSSSTALVAAGQIVYDVDTVKASQPYHDLVVRGCVADCEASLGFTIEGFSAIRWRLDLKHDISAYGGSFLKSAIDKAVLGTLCICSAGAVVEEIYLNYEVQASRIYASWGSYPSNPYPNSDLIYTGFDTVDVMLSQGSAAAPAMFQGDEIYLRLDYPELLLQMVVNYYILVDDVVGDSVGVTNLSIPF